VAGKGRRRWAGLVGSREGGERVTDAETGQEPSVLRDKVAAEMAIRAWWLDWHGQAARAAALRADPVARQIRAAETLGEAREPGG
jgi:hypothetical protein